MSPWKLGNAFGPIAYATDGDFLFDYDVENQVYLAHSVALLRSSDHSATAVLASVVYVTCTSKPCN